MVNVIDETVDSWTFMSTPWSVFSILSLYLMFVLKFGPSLMENRKPMNLKYAILLYNVGQTIYNAFIVSMVSHLFIIF